MRRGAGTAAFACLTVGSLLLGGCASTTPVPAASPSSAAAKGAASKTAGSKAAKGRKASSNKAAANEVAKRLPATGAHKSAAGSNQPGASPVPQQIPFPLGNQVVQVQPVALNLASLPFTVLPEPHKMDDAPDSLPSGIRNADEITSRVSGNAEQTETWHAYVSVNKPLSRIQIGNISAGHPSGRQLYRKCGDRDGIVPARWMSLSRLRGKVTLQLSDGWFNHKTCTVAVTRDTAVQPKPILDGLAWAFRTRCDTCSHKEWLVLLAPPLSVENSSGLAATPSVTPGPMTIIRMPLGRGTASSLMGRVQGHALLPWQQKLKLKLPASFAATGVGLGLDLVQSVSEKHASAIVYTRSSGQQLVTGPAMQRGGFGMRGGRSGF